MRTPSPSMRLVVAALMLWLQVASLPFGALGAGTARAQAPAAAKPPVQQGLEYYEQSRFDEAIGLLRDLVDRGQLTGDDLLKARELLARSYVKKGYPGQAKDMFKSILRDNPAYRPDPIKIPPDESAVFEQALKEYESEKTPPAGVPPPGGTTPPAPAGPSPGIVPAPVVVPVHEGKKSLFSQWWFWVAGAAVVGGAAALAGGGGGSGEGGTPTGNSLPGFPPPPP